MQIRDLASWKGLDNPTVMLKRFVAFTAITAASTLSNIPSVSAQTARVSIPASACAPANPNSQSLVRISNGAYTFAPNSTGQATFYCPLPLDTDVIPRLPANSQHTAAVYYRDTDGTGNTAFVLVRLQRRDTDGLQNVSNEFTSSSRSETNNTFACIPFNHDFSSSNLYFFRVIMTRSNTNQDPAFSGIIFANPCGSNIP